MKKEFKKLDLKSISSRVNAQNSIPETQNSFASVFNQYDWDETLSSIFNKTATDVEHALQNPKRDLEDFKALISPLSLIHI